MTTPPYIEDADGIIRYHGDNFRPNIDYTANRRSAIGRNGIDVFRPVLSGESTEPTPRTHQVRLTGTLEPGDIYTLSIDSNAFNYEVRPGDTAAAEVLDSIALQINESASQGTLESVAADRDGSNLIVSTLDGATRVVSGSTRNTSEAVDDLSVSLDSNPDDTHRLSLEGTTEPGTGSLYRSELGRLVTLSPNRSSKQTDPWSCVT